MPVALIFLPNRKHIAAQHLINYKTETHVVICKAFDRVQTVFHHDRLPIHLTYNLIKKQLLNNVL